MKTVHDTCKSIYMMKCVFADDPFAKHSADSCYGSHAWFLFWRTCMWVCVLSSFLINQVANSGGIGAGHSGIWATLKLPMVREIIFKCMLSCAGFRRQRGNL